MPIVDHRSLILIVDDQPLGRESLASPLEPEGYRLAFAASGPEALVLAGQQRPDLVLLDVMMPEMDGFEVCRRMRADPDLALVPIVMVTALDQQSALLRTLEAGADDFLTKPFSRAELRARVRTITRLNRYKRLWESRERFERLVEQSPVGVALLDAGGQVVLANPALRELLGVPCGPQALPSFPALAPPERRPELVAGLGRLIAGEATELHLETSLVVGDGSRRPVELVAGRCEWDSGPAVQLIVRDITDRRRAELLEEERQLVAYELHDGTAQLVTSIYQRLQLYQRRHRPRSEHAASELQELVGVARQAIRELRRVIEALRPTALDDFGLAGALRMLIDSLRDEGCAITLSDELGAERLPSPVETTMFRIAQEALANVRKHAGPTPCRVTVSRMPEAVCLEVRDWGCGFDPAAGLASDPGKHLGLRGMRERAALLGGELQLTTAPGEGVVIFARVPVAARAQR